MHLTNIMFEVSSRQVKEAILQPHNYPMFRHIISQIRDLLGTLGDWHIDCISGQCNRCAQDIAASVIRDHRYQSYIAREGPSWLHHLLSEDAIVILPQQQNWKDALLWVFYMFAVL